MSSSIDLIHSDNIDYVPVWTGTISYVQFYISKQHIIPKDKSTYITTFSQLFDVQNPPLYFEGCRQVFTLPVY